MAATTAPAAEAAPRMPWALLAAACFATFATTASGTTRAPFLLDMSHDLAVDLATVANLFGLTSISWGAASFFAGAGSDRWGRRVFLVGGPLLLAGAMLGTALGQSFLAVAVWGTLAGACSGLFTGVSMAEVSGRVLDRQRGRALGWVLAGQSMTLLVGVPGAAWLGAWVGWRGVNVAVAGMALASAAAMFATTLGPGGGRPLPGTPKPSLRRALSRPVLLLLASVVAERVCFGLAAVYYATFLQTSYAVSLAGLALPLFLFALGNILGTLLGGQLADRLRHRLRTFAAAMLASGAVAVALFGWRPSLEVSVGLGFAYVLCNAIARPSLMAALANVPAEVRGTVMGLNSTSASLGWLGAAALGGWMLAGPGFAGFGPLTCVLALLGAALALAGPRTAAAMR